MREDHGTQLLCCWLSCQSVAFSSAFLSLKSLFLVTYFLQTGQRAKEEFLLPLIKGLRFPAEVTPTESGDDHRASSKWLLQRLIIVYQGLTGKQHKFIKSYFSLFTLQLVNSSHACFLLCQCLSHSARKTVYFGLRNLGDYGSSYQNESQSQMRETSCCCQEEYQIIFIHMYTKAQCLLVPGCDHHSWHMSPEERNLQSFGQGQMQKNVQSIEINQLPQCIPSSVCCWCNYCECNKCSHF